MTRLAGRTAELRGDDVALVDERGAITWAELDRRSIRLIHALRAMRLAPGDVIGIYAGNCREYFELLTAASHTGLVYERGTTMNLEPLMTLYATVGEAMAVEKWRFRPGTVEYRIYRLVGGG